MSESEYITVKEAATLAHVTVRTIERWVEKKAITVKRTPGRKLLLLRKEVEPQ
jgi:excisionase family DNA binding protein